MARYLADAANGLLPGNIVASLVLLKVAIALEVLVPTTLYFSVVLSLGRMYADSEITALSACGVPMTRIIKAVFAFSLLLSAFAASLSLYIRPWAYEKFYQLIERAEAEFDITRMEAGTFHKINQGNRIIFAEKIDHKRNRAKRVFIQSERDGILQIIRAKEAYQRVDKNTGKEVLLFLDGYHYEFPRNNEGGHIIKFQRSTLSLEPAEVPPVGYKRKAASTTKLAQSDNRRDIAELQWRLSTPLSTILLALLGVPLSKTAPRRGKYAKMGAAVLIFAVYYNTIAMARTWVEQGIVGATPGIWWAPAVLAGLLLALLLQTVLEFRFRRSHESSSP